MIGYASRDGAGCAGSARWASRRRPVYRPRCEAGFGSGGRARYAAIWEQAGGGGDLVGIDGVVQRAMSAAGVTA